MAVINLYSPRESWTSRSALLLWDQPKTAVITRVFVDSQPAAHAYKGGITLTGLAPDTTYQVRIETTMGDGSVLCSTPCQITTAPTGPVLNITKYGAVGDGKTLNTAAIQQAIDACPERGTVLIPAGCFVSGALFLHGAMTLHLCEGAKLLGSPDLADYPVMPYRFEGREMPGYASLINTRDGTHAGIAITGSGTIDGNGALLFPQEIPQAKTIARGRTVCIRDTDGVYLQGVVIRQSPSWCTHLIYCANVTLNGVQIDTRRDENGAIYDGIFNGDGFDPDSCRNVNVFDCMIASQDDCIAVKSGRDAEGRQVGIPSENIRITDCLFRSGFGIALGSEMSGGIRNVLIRDCTFHNAYSILSIKTPRGRGGAVEHVLCERVTHENYDQFHTDCKWFRGALYLDMYYGKDEMDLIHPQPVTDATSVIRDITIRDAHINTHTGNSIYLCGLPESHIQDVLLEDIEADGLNGMKAYMVDGLTLRNVHMHAQNGPKIESMASLIRVE